MVCFSREIGVVFGARRAIAALPGVCGSCGQVAEPRHALAASGAGAPFRVSYCVGCDLWLARRRLLHTSAAGLAALLTALATAAVFILSPWLGWFAQWGLVLAAAGAPFGALCVAHLARPELSRVEGARLSGADLLGHPAFVRVVAQASGLPCGTRRAASPLLLAGIGGVLLTGVAAWASSLALHPVLVIVNVRPVPVRILVDGRSVARLPAGGFENAAATRRVRVPVGLRRLKGVDEEGHVGAELMARFAPGKVHLFAPGRSGHCFWREVDGYGRVAGRRVEPMSLTQQFWVLDGVDSWFSPNPASVGDRWSSGGVMVALRHALCDLAPGGAAAPSGPRPPLPSWR